MSSSKKRGQEALSFPRIYSRALRGWWDVGVHEGREAIRGMGNLKPPNPGRGIKLYMPRLHQSRVPRTFAVSKVWKYMYWIQTDSSIVCGWVKAHMQS